MRGGAGEGDHQGSGPRADRLAGGQSGEEELAQTRQHAIAEITASRGRLGLPFELLLASPELARRTARVGEYLRFHGVLPGDLRELAILTVAREQQCQFEWDQHLPIAEREGLSPEAIALADCSSTPERSEEGAAGVPVAGASGTDAPGPDRRTVSALERSVVDAVRGLMRHHRLPIALRAQLQEVFGEQGFVELVGTVGYYTCLATVMNAYDDGPARAPS